MDLLTALTRATPWSDRAACAGVPDDFEFVPNGSYEEQNPQWVVPRLDYCERCPVRVECLRFALETNSDGIWGGTLSTDRKQAVPFASNRDRHRRDGTEEAIRRSRIAPAVKELEAGFEDRIGKWRARLEEMRRACVDCGGDFFASPRTLTKRCPDCRPKKKAPAPSQDEAGAA